MITPSHTFVSAVEVVVRMGCVTSCMRDSRVAVDSTGGELSALGDVGKGRVWLAVWMCTDRGERGISEDRVRVLGTIKK